MTTILDDVSDRRRFPRWADPYVVQAQDRCANDGDRSRVIAGGLRRTAAAPPDAEGNTP